MPRPEYELTLPPLDDQPLERTLPWAVRLWQQGWLRKTVILVALACMWEGAARWQANDLLLPGVGQTFSALFDTVMSGELGSRVWTSLSVLIQAYFLGVAIAFLFTSLAVSTQVGRDLLATLTSMFNPLPAIALLPLALLWFGLVKA